MMDAPPTLRDAAALRGFLAERDAPCPVCGYSLRALVTDKCPECGRHLVLTVGTTEPRLGVYIAGLVGWSIGLGFCLLLLVWIAILFLRGSGGPTADIESKMALGTAVSGTGLTLWILVPIRRRVARLPLAVGVLLVAACSAVSLACPVWFMLTVM